MLSRVLEPEVMDSADEAEDYNAMDHSQVNRVFVDDFLSALNSISKPTWQPWRIFDAGTGTALIPIELMRRGIPFDVTAADLAEQMLIVARRNVAQAGYDSSIRLVRSDCKRLDDADATYDAVMSNSIIHHIPQPVAVLQECWRILRPGGLLFIRDLMRPQDDRQLERLVEMYAASANAHGREMFRASLHAALTVGDVADLIKRLGIVGSVQATSDRHWTLAAVKP